MKYLLAIVTVLALTGCSTTLVKRNFPDIPPSLETSCPELKIVAEDTDKLSDVLKVVTANYAQYHECRIKVETWMQWYKEQKANFESVK